ncbi:MAG: DNA mismatch repair protein MutS [Clostridia bacterium]|nr:DNA mismatch repair protein MutS [Clostridia bacterium]
MALSPAMKKYLELKAQYPDCVVFYRLGDFYEIFFDDAKQVSAAIGLTLTGRSCGLEEKAPMCGVPYHAANLYIKKLVELGFKIAIAEQLEAPNGKTLINRDVVRVITSGTVIDDAMLNADSNNFVCSIYEVEGSVSVYAAWADIMTGEFYVAQFDCYDNAVSRIRPKEVITKKHFAYAFTNKQAMQTVKKYFNINTTQVFDIPENSPLINAAGALLEYLLMTAKNKLSNITKIVLMRDDNFMVLDKIARDTLEIVVSYRNNTKAGSLLAALDKTETPMGARLLADWVTAPLKNVTMIQERQDVVQELYDHSVTCQALRVILDKFNDLGRFCGKVANGNVNPKDILNFTQTLSLIEEIKAYISQNCHAKLLAELSEELNPLTKLRSLLLEAIKTEPSTILSDGGYIKDGYNKQLDELRNIGTLGKQWLLALETKERAETGVEKLKIAYNRVAGYYLEFPMNALKQMPYRFIRKGSTLNTERYTTDELREIESKILNASGEAIKLEQTIFAEIITEVQKHIPVIQQDAAAIASIDVLANLAYLAYKNQWVRPVINTDGVLELEAARHPVLETVLPANEFIANDCDLNRENTTMLITGPNMAGKSTYMKTVALNVIMAHLGSFVPCNRANISLTDRVFTRIGASDDMMTGKSTFMVEMNEVSNIVHNATKDSLLLLDEIGRGTGTNDGYALAKAILTYIIEQIGSKTLCATHFHELIELGHEYSQVQNYKVLTSSINGQIVFLHKVVRGEEQNSFGAEVAQLSGLPEVIIQNAKKIMKERETYENH